MVISYAPTLTGAQSFVLCDSQIVYISSASGTVVLASTDTTAPGGHIYSAVGTYLDTLITASGCDSILTTTITACPLFLARKANPAVVNADKQETDDAASKTNEALGSIKVYPNPSTDFTTVVFNLAYAEETVVLSLMDINGKNIITLDKSMNGSMEGTFKLNVAALASGTYYVRLQGKLFNQVQKLEVINH
jgi:hypothetical protein